ncbi:MAG: hypothetical protein IPG45_23310 [Deltaproteobacteria bacterium]|nr:hypothetical protein [Deltaproteobacteria bacterium]
MRFWACGLWLAVCGCSLINSVDADRIPIEVCDDGVDNDASGRSDCRDLACQDHPACATETTLDTCTDGRDNEPNGRFDCGEPSCQVFAVCQERGGVSCEDGLDNDQDGHLDCDDAACAFEPSCVTRSAFVAQPRCPSLREGLNFRDEWTTIDTERWSVFSSNSRDRPRLVDGGLDPRGDNFWSSGVATIQKIGLGSQQPFALEVAIRAQAGCDRPAPSGATCLISVSVDTREEWGDGLPFGASLFGLYAQVLPGEGGRGPELLVIATYHPEPNLPPLAGVRIPWSAERSYRGRMALDPSSRELVFSLDDVELARTPILSREPLGRVVIQSQLDRPNGPGTMLLDWIDLQIQDEMPEPDCLGRSRNTSVLPTAYCRPDVPYNTGLGQPSVAWNNGDYFLLFYGSYALNRFSNGLAISSDGLSFDALIPPAGSSERRSLLAFSGNFEITRASLAARPDEHLLRAWHYHYGPNDPVLAWLSTASPEDPTIWTKVGPLNADGPMPLGPNRTVHPVTVVAEASVIWQGDRYLAYYPFAPEVGRPAVFALESQDGQNFRALRTDPVLRPTTNTFDADSIRAVAATPLGSGVLLAYVGNSFADGAAVGLAYADDGVHFVKHQDNPILRPDPDDLTALGISGLTLRVEGAKLRLWLTGQSAGVDCADDTLDVGTRSKVGHFVFEPADR